MCRQQTVLKHKSRGCFSDYKNIEREITSIWHAHFLMISHKIKKIKLHFGYKCGISFTKLAFRLQKLRFVYKYSVVSYKHCISIYKVAFRITINHRN